MMQNLFDGFLSYHRKAEGQFAATLQQRLERKYRRLPKSLRAKHKRLRICRDATDFTAGQSSVERTVTQRLSESSKLLVLCSPSARESEWVAFEISTYRATHRSSGNEGIIALLCSGPDPVVQSVLPAALNIPGGEPLAVDFRVGSFQSLRSHARFCKDEGLLRILAPLLNIEYPDLVNRQRQYELKQIRQRAALAMFVILALLGLSWYANDRRIEAKAMEYRALRRLEVSLALAREVHSIIDEQLSTIPGTASTRKALLEKTSAMLKELSLSAPDDSRVDKEGLAVNDRKRDVEVWHDGLARLDADELERQLALVRKLRDRDPANADLQRGEAVARIHLGELHYIEERWDEARAEYGKARVILNGILAGLPLDHAWYADLAILETRCGDIDALRDLVWVVRAA